MEIYKSFGIVTAELEPVVDTKKLQEMRNNEFTGYFSAIPDIPRFSFYRAVRDIGNVSGFHFLSKDTQRNIFNFIANDNLEEYLSIVKGKIDPVLLICNGILSYENKPTIEDAVETMNEILSDEDLDTFCEFYDVKEEDRLEKIKGVIEEQAFYFWCIREMGIKHIINGVDVIDVLIFE